MFGIFLSHKQVIVLQMKVLFDHQIFYQIIGGASKYFAMMINSLPKGSWETTTLLSCNTYVRSLHLFKHSFPYVFRGQPRVLDFLNKPYTQYVLSKQNYDVFHQTNFGTYCLKDIGMKPMVTTFHDANFLRNDPHPELVKLQEASLRRADMIICVSENTRKDMLSFFDVDEKKTCVVYHGIDIPDLRLLPKRRLIDDDYILYVGRRHRYKNFRRFIEAYAIVIACHPEVKLVCTGDAFNSEECLFMKKLGVMDNVVLFKADETEMKMLYRDALFFVFPSLYEGFGMPILEAWSCDCPVLLSKASCFPEIAGNAGLYFQPESVDDMADKMEMAFSDEMLRRNLVERGRKRVSKFSWKRCAEEHFAIYNSLK